jgi:sugar/nucleoside kinase (ribokinase family)
VNNRIKEAIPEIIFQLRQKRVAEANAFIGFDACIDNIVRIVKDKDENNGTGYYNDCRQFGEFLINLDDKSCGIELHTKISKIGGNMVITANALGNLGIRVECVGTFGLPDILPVFHAMSSNCSLHTVGNTITATALEFNDSKVIMFDPGPYNELDWDGIKDLIGIERIKQLLSGKQLISFLNWSEIENSSLIWEGVLDEILPSVEKTGVRPVFFTDFSDCSRRSKKQILSALEILGRFRDYFRTIISLNQNEADLIAKALDLSTYSSDENFIRSLYNTINTDALIIHRVKDAVVYDGSSFEKCDTFFCQDPAVLTGGGDNFNAGFCLSSFYDFDLFQSLVIANAVSGYYVRIGISPDVDSLIEFLEQIN